MITIDQVADIKKKLDVLKEKKARAEGAMEAIRSRWKDEYSATVRMPLKQRLDLWKRRLSRRNDALLFFWIKSTKLTRGRQL
jgi:hypothetical protein